LLGGLRQIPTSRRVIGMPLFKRWPLHDGDLRHGSCHRPPGALRTNALALCLLSLPVFAAESGWSLEIYGGAPVNVSAPLTILHAGAPALRTTAHYETRPFDAPFYYDVRVGWWRDGAEWAIELTHHKIFLINPPPDVQNLASSHGYNLLTVSRGWQLPYGFWGRVGLGMVVSHPESTVRERTFAENGGIFGLGYYLSGATVTASLQKRVYLAGGLFIAAAGMLSASYAVVPISGGSARTPNFALHALLGIGYRFGGSAP